MSPLFGSRKPKQDKKLAQISLLAAVPAMLIAGPAVGFVIGKWLDGKYQTDPLFLIVGLIFGFAAAAREIYNLVKKAESLEEDDDEPKDGS